MKIILNPAFQSLKTFVENIPQNFESQGRTIYKSRNEIKVFQVNGIEVNVKRYKRPIFINKIIYTFIRQSKGIRAYNYPMQLLSKGIESPEPIAYIELKHWGLIDYSYFISVQSPYPNTLYSFGDANLEEYREVAIAFAKFTAKVHDLGVYHQDYSPGNILYDKINGEYHFSLIDINRMSFGKVDIKRGCANFARLWGPKELYVLITKEYAKARGFDEEECLKLVFQARDKFKKRLM